MKKMKNYLLNLKVLIIVIISIISVITNAQSIPRDSIIYNNDSIPMYYHNEIIIKFNPKFVDSSIINDTSKQIGYLSDFINQYALQVLIDSGYYDDNFANLVIRKIHKNMTINDDSSVSRLGNQITIPAFWSCFVLIWDESTGLKFMSAIDSLRRAWPIVEYAHPNYIISPFHDPLWNSEEQGGLGYTNTFGSNPHINITPAWDNNIFASDNCKVGIYDSGINWFHDDFSEDGSNSKAKSRIKGGYNAFTNKDFNQDNSSVVWDDNGHGTAVASIIGAIRNNDIGMEGIAGGNFGQSFGAQLYDYRILFDSKLMYGRLDYVINLIRLGATSVNKGGHGLHLMNHSWGATVGYAAIDAESMKDVVRYAYINDVIFVAGSGNSGDINVFYPASYRDEWVIKTGGSTTNGNWWPVATYGHSIDVIAPSVYQLYSGCDYNNNGTYSYQGNGTSFATPHVTGTSALMIDYIKNNNLAPNPLAPDDVEKLLEINATRIDSSGDYGYHQKTGWGRINAGQTNQNILLPHYEVKHYVKTFNNSDATLIGVGVPITIKEKRFGITPGIYTGNIYKITKTFDITQSTHRIVLDVWKRNSESTLFGLEPFYPEVDPVLNNWNQTSAQMDGYIYEFTNWGGISNLSQWMPQTGLTGVGSMALTVYSFNEWSNSINIKNIKSFNIYPNPNSTGAFKISSNFIGKVQLSITDAVGKNILLKEFENNNLEEMDFVIPNAESAVYFCTLITQDGRITRKISIIK